MLLFASQCTRQELQTHLQGRQTHLLAYNRTPGAGANNAVLVHEHGFNLFTTDLGLAQVQLRTITNKSIWIRYTKSDTEPRDLQCEAEWQSERKRSSIPYENLRNAACLERDPATFWMFCVEGNDSPKMKPTPSAGLISPSA